MAEPTSDKHYEERFEFPLWELIKKCAREKDVSYYDAGAEVVKEYIKTIRYRDTEFEDAAIDKRREEAAGLAAELARREREESEKKARGG